MTTLRFFGIISLVLVQFGCANATMVVNWDGGVGGQNYLGEASSGTSFQGTYTVGNVNYGGAAATDRQSIRGYKPTSAFSPGAPYPNGVTGYSTTFYGAQETLAIDQTSGAPWGQRGIAQSSASGDAKIKTTSVAVSYDYVLTTLIVFKKSDFLGGADSGTLSLGAGSVFSLTVAPSVTSNMRGRWLVESGGVYYLSEITFSLDSGTHDYTYDPDGNWAVYTPSTASGTVLNFTGTNFTTQTLNDVDALGFYVETWDGTDQILTGSTLASMQVTDFSVNVVPEPSVSMLMISAAGLLLGMWCQKK